MISKNLAYFFVFPDMFCNFAPMEAKNKNLSVDQDIIRGLFNHDKNVEDQFYEICKKIIWTVINKYYFKKQNKTQLFYELANEFYIYIIKNPQLLKNFKGSCEFEGYLTSIAKHHLSYDFGLDQAHKDAKKAWDKLEEKIEKIIREFDNEPENYHVNEPTHIPKKFWDEDSADDFLIFNSDDDEEDDNDDKDIIVDIDKISNTYSEVVYTDKCQLVRETLEQMPPKQAELLKLQFFKGIKDNKELAKRLGVTINTLYNLRNRAIESFITCFNHLKRQQYEEN